MPMLLRLLEVALDVGVLVFAVSVHESAHGWMAARWGDTTARDLGRITLNPLRHVDPVGSLVVPAVLAVSGMPVFGWARPVPVVPARFRDPRRGMMEVAAAGPGSNLLLAAAAVAALLLLRAVYPPVPELVIAAVGSGGSPMAAGAGGVLVAVLTMTLVINVVLAVFNLIPVPPLDGSGIVAGLLPPEMAARYRALGRYGFLVVFALLWLGAFDIVLRPILVGILRLVVG